MASANAISHSTISGNNRILAVDDDQGILETYVDLLQPGRQRFSELKKMMGVAPPVDAGFVLSVAHQGSVAVDMVKEKTKSGLPYAVAFLDMRMPPGMNGLATAKAIRAVDARVFIVIVTAYSDHSLDEIYQELGRDVLLLRKPFAEDELLQVARTLTDIWNREDLRARELDEAKQYSQRLDCSPFHRADGKKRAPYLQLLERIPRVVLVDRDRAMVAKLAAYFPQASRYRSFSAWALKRQPEVLIARIEDDGSAVQRKLSVWLRQRRHDTAFLLYGPGVADFVRAGTRLLRGALIGLLPEQPNAPLLAHTARRLLELRNGTYDLTDPDWPLLGKAALFKRAMNEANRMAQLGKTVLIRGHRLDVIAVARYMHRASSAPGALKTLSGTLFAPCRSAAQAQDVFDHAMRDNVSGCILIDQIDVLPADLIQPVARHARAHGIELLLCGAHPDAPVDIATFQPFVIDVPVIARRHEDWRLLADYFMLQYALRTGEPVSLTDGGIAPIENQSIRDLYAIRDAVFSDLTLRHRTAEEASVQIEHPPPCDLDDQINRFEAAAIAQVLKRCEGNISQAARLLGLRPNTLHYRLKRHGIEYKK